MASLVNGSNEHLTLELQRLRQELATMQRQKEKLNEELNKEKALWRETSKAKTRIIEALESYKKIAALPPKQIQKWEKKLKVACIGKLAFYNSSAFKFEGKQGLVFPASFEDMIAKMTDTTKEEIFKGLAEKVSKTFATIVKIKVEITTQKNLRTQSPECRQKMIKLDQQCIKLLETYNQELEATESKQTKIEGKKKKGKVAKK